jgi:hypothetical protein
MTRMKCGLDDTDFSAFMESPLYSMPTKHRLMSTDLELLYDRRIHLNE